VRPPRPTTSMDYSNMFVSSKEIMTPYVIGTLLMRMKITCQMQTIRVRFEKVVFIQVINR
jgi:hypothetical protein